MTRITIASACAAVVFGLAGSSHAQEAAIAPPVPAIYVGEFQPAQAPTAEQSGPLHALVSRVHAHHVDRNAEKLSRALVRALKNHNAFAETLPADALPRSGWIVRGVFYSLDSGRLIAVPFLGAHKGPNVEVTVTIANAANDPDTPFAVIGTDAALKGQGTPMGWNPYVVAGTFVIEKAARESSMDALAERIAVKILDNRSDLDQHDPARQH